METVGPLTWPGRVKLRRVKGWRLPRDVMRVDRSTRRGNPFRCHDPVGAVAIFRARIAGDDAEASRLARACGASVVGPVGLSARAEVLASLPLLRGRRLACWCAPDQPCHTDVFLEHAGAEAEAYPA
ncbi:MAG: DUF4326 domain-containing protein [Elioraea sp.]|nr:DUF4326 domain-containing protein [Elioraea sp.]